LPNWPTESIVPTRRNAGRQFLDELKATVPVHPVTEATAEIIARIGSEQAANGINLPLADLIIGACALELGYAIGTHNARDFKHSRLDGPVTLVRPLEMRHLGRLDSDDPARDTSRARRPRHPQKQSPEADVLCYRACGIQRAATACSHKTHIDVDDGLVDPND
jgi:hypothetical protein